MKQKDVLIGGRYLAKVSGHVVPVRITGESRYGGWDAVNVETGRAVRIKGVQRLRGPADESTHERWNKVLRKAAKDISKVLGIPVGVVPPSDDAGKEESVKENGLGVKYHVKVDGKPAAISVTDDRGPEAAASVAARMLDVPVERVSVTDPGSVCAALRGHEEENAMSKKSVKPSKKAAGKSKTEAAPKTPKPKAKAKAPKAPREGGQMSGLDAAAKVIEEAGQPLNCQMIVDLALSKGYWKTGGKTPAATVYAAIIREIAAKGDASRFAKSDRGMFTVRK